MSAHCHYCGLPVPAPLWSVEEPVEPTPQYCCFGCQLAHSLVQEPGAEGASRWALTQLGLAIFLTMNVMVCTFALWAFDTGGFDVSEKLAATFADVLRFAGMVLAIPVLFLLGQPILESAWSQLRRGILSTDLLLMSGVFAAFGYSVLSVWRSQFGFEPGPVYFEVGCMILVLVSLGRWLEATGKLKSTQALNQLQKLLPSQVRRVTRASFELVPLADLQPGDQVLVEAGERIPTDGQLLSASASLDEQLISGESWPREKVQGESLWGGTLNLAGSVVLQVSAPANAGTLSRLIAAVQEARDHKGRYEQWADRISRWFFPIMVGLALLTFAVHAWLTSIMAGLLAALSVVLIACPCALGLATPMALWAAMGTAARRGIVFRSPEALERLATLKAIRFDKTGTLTTGQPHVTTVTVAQGLSLDDVLSRSAALAGTSSHVFSRAIVDYCKSHSTSSSLPSAPGLIQGTAVSGRGVHAVLNADSLPTVLGNRPLMDELGLQFPPDLQQPLANVLECGQPYVLIGWNGHVQGLFHLSETLRPAVSTVLAAFRESGLNVGVLTGDHLQAGARLARELGIDVEAALTPQDKSARIQQLHTQLGEVGFVGDGVNDAPALAAADVGITLGCGADVTRDSADVCLLSDDIAQLPELIELSRQTARTIQANLAWAFGYNFLGVLVAMTGLLHPALAAALMVGSSLYVITNSLRLSRLSEEAATSNEMHVITEPEAGTAVRLREEVAA